MSVINARATSRVPSDASPEEQKRHLDRMLKVIREAFSEIGGIKDKIEKYEYYRKPSEKRRMREKIERNRALSKKREAKNERN